jgi:hypothetical protein
VHKKAVHKGLPSVLANHFPTKRNYKKFQALYFHGLLKLFLIGFPGILALPAAQRRRLRRSVLYSVNLNFGEFIYLKRGCICIQVIESITALNSCRIYDTAYYLRLTLILKKHLNFSIEN